MSAANGTATIKGVRRSEGVVAGSVLVFGEGWRMGRMENCVRRRVRPMASGMAMSSSKGREGDLGRKRRREVRVSRVSGGQYCFSTGCVSITAPEDM